ncbi:MAG TPA: isoamylase early set domain-containing protein [Gemmatimonadales bacterium]|nr:isoamylase early set domain-containing protein [Gemmatimonadales bacterium]
MTTGYHPLVKRLLDGELSLAELPPELRAEGEEALRLVGAADRAPVALSPALEERVMAAVRHAASSHAASPGNRAWRWLNTPRDVELRLRVRPWTVWAGALAAAAALALLLGRPAPQLVPGTQARGGMRDSVLVRFVLYAPGARRVAVAGTFNQWDRAAAPLVPAGRSGVWTTTLALPVGQHQYAFVVDGGRWVADPGAPAVDDGFGRRNSVVAVTAQGAHL